MKKLYVFIVIAASANMILLPQINAAPDGSGEIQAGQCSLKLNAVGDSCAYNLTTYDPNDQTNNNWQAENPAHLTSMKGQDACGSYPTGIAEENGACGSYSVGANAKE
jgi:hypothetical protein